MVESGVHLKVHEANLNRKKNNKKFRVHKNLDSNVALLKIFPGIHISILKSVLGTPGLRALVLETYGAGNAPTDKGLVQELKKALDKGLHIVNVTQCSGGSVLMGQYETSEQLEKLQVINGKDITTEAAIAKLMYLLGSGVSPKLLKSIFETPLRGEMS